MSVDALPLSCFQRSSAPGSRAVGRFISPLTSSLAREHREHVQRSEESSSSLAASLRHQSMKQSPSQHSFDSAILDGSLPDESLSADSDVSDGFFVLMDSGTSEDTLNSVFE